MNDRDKHLSYALDSLIKLEESLAEHHQAHEISDFAYHDWRITISDAKVSIEQATLMPKPSKIRDLFQRLGRAA
jgi:hypothetical protein